MPKQKIVSRAATDVLMLAAENGALEHGKVGGLGDVIHYLPLALSEVHVATIVLTPCYGLYSNTPGAREIGQVTVVFAGKLESVKVIEVKAAEGESLVRHVVLKHRQFESAQIGQIYCHDETRPPFSTDATKFAFFCMAAAACLRDNVLAAQTVHLHDWHSALFLALRAYHPDFKTLQPIPVVFTIHNLAMQGIRPLDGHQSSFENWFPKLNYRHDVLVDPRYHNCVNPMALAIRLADKVNTVSPSYQQEILKPDNAEHGFHGGQGLELDLRVAFEEHRLSGILNGCHYEQAAAQPARRPAWKALRDAMLIALTDWMSISTYVRSSHYLTLMKIKSRLRIKPTTIVLTIGRLTEQKVALLLQPTQSGQLAIEQVLEAIGPGSLYVVLGHGDNQLERQFAQLSQRHRGLLFLNGFTDGLPELLYRSADLFVMPSSYEPCGIAQMLALREGVPCIVHGVGGLKDTVSTGQNGIVFNGLTPSDQAENLVNAVRRAISMKTETPRLWQELRQGARDSRFSWANSAKEYAKKLYQIELNNSARPKQIQTPTVCKTFAQPNVPKVSAKATKKATGNSRRKANSASSNSNIKAQSTASKSQLGAIGDSSISKLKAKSVPSDLNLKESGDPSKSNPKANKVADKSRVKANKAAKPKSVKFQDE